MQGLQTGEPKLGFRALTPWENLYNCDDSPICGLPTLAYGLVHTMSIAPPPCLVVVPSLYL